MSNQFELQLKEQGMSLSASANKQWLEMARGIAEEVARQYGKCSIEDVRRMWPYESFPKGNWTGSIFNTGKWKHIGWETAKHKGSHGRQVKVWRYVA